MLKKILAGVSALALAVGIAAFTSVTGPALSANAIGAGHSPAADGETCVTFDSGAIAAGSPMNSGAVTATFASPDTTWSISSSGDPLATIEVESNGVWSSRTGQTSFSGDAGAAIDGAWICTKPAPAPAPVVQSLVSVPDPTPYVVVAWLMPSWSGDYLQATWPQTFFAKVDSATVNLGALDGQLTTCGTSYQVDVYNDSAITTALIAGGHLYGDNNPAEDEVQPPGWGTTYKLVHNADCLPRNASASVSVTTPTCRAQGTATFSLSHATWADTTGPEDQTVGDHTRTANAKPGHLFSNGLTSITVSYTIPGVLDAFSPNCYRPVPVKPSYSSIHGCGVYGSITLVDTTYITYAITSGDGTQGLNTVTATAVSPYVLDPSSAASWVIDLGSYQDCYKPAATWNVGLCTLDPPSSSLKELAVSFDNTGSTVAVTFTIPGASISELVGAGATDTVDIPIGTGGSPALKVYADGSLLTTIDAIDAFDGCVPVTVTADPGSAATCNVDGSVADGAVNVDFEPAVVTYTITGGTLGAPLVAAGPSTPLPAGTYTVTAQALPGYVLSGSSSWQETIDDPSPCGPPDCSQQLGRLSTASLTTLDAVDPADPGDCDPPTLASWDTAAYVTQPTCSTHDGVLTVGDVGGGVSFFSEVDYFLDGVPITSPTMSIAPGHYTVTASPHTAGDGLTGPSSFDLTVTASNLACGDLKTLALTGTTPAGWLALAYGLLTVGLGMVIMRRLRRPRTQN